MKSEWSERHMSASNIEQSEAYCANSEQYQKEYRKDAEDRAEPLTDNRRGITFAHTGTRLKFKATRRTSARSPLVDKRNLIMTLRTKCDRCAHWNIVWWTHSYTDG
jgi:hypothetical protein